MRMCVTTCLKWHAHVSSSRLAAVHFVLGMHDCTAVGAQCGHLAEVLADHFLEDGPQADALLLLLWRRQPLPPVWRRPLCPANPVQTDVSLVSLQIQSKLSSKPHSWGLQSAGSWSAATRECRCKFCTAM
jgi:hypothetical protein